MTVYSDIALGDKWDITLSSDGDLAIKKSAEALAQTIAVECRVALRDKYFDFDKGIDYHSILGTKTELESLQREINDTALSVDGVSSVMDVSINEFDFETREISGELTVVMEDGTIVEVTL